MIPCTTSVRFDHQQKRDIPECAVPHDLTGPYCVRLWRPWRKKTLSFGHSSFSFISSITVHSEGVNYACCIMSFLRSWMQLASRNAADLGTSATLT